MRRIIFLLLLGLAAAAPARAADPPRRFVVFFTEWSAALDAPAQRVVRDAAQWATAHPDAPITVSGAADMTGTRQANRLLSELRAQVVTDLLAQDGVPESRVRQIGLGSVEYALSGQESRRVVIQVGGGS